MALAAGLGLAILVALAASCLLGVTPIAAADWADVLRGRGDPALATIVWDIRLPRALAALVTGAALGASGAALQGLLRNPLAEPGVLGVSASASLMAIVAIHWGFVALSPWVLPCAAIAGALVATALIAALAPRVGSVTTLVLIGVGLSSLSGALMSLLLNFAPNPFTLADMVSWSLGSVANRSFADLGLAAPFCAAGLATLALAAPGLRALALGEETAASLGLDVRACRLLTVVGAGLATGGAVALAGAVGFVGIVAPHLVRPWVGHDPARTLVPAALTGGLMLILADVAARLAPGDQELKLGVVAALVGAPAFIGIVARRRALEAQA
jgi:iron complex transport system permease protein